MNTMNDKETQNYMRDLIKKASHFYNVISVAYADGDLSDGEQRYLTRLAEKYKIGKNELTMIRSGHFEKTISPPVKTDKKFEQVLELIIMMLADGYPDKSELRICNKVANEYGFEEKLIDNLMTELLKLAESTDKNPITDFDLLNQKLYKKFKNDLERQIKKSRGDRLKRMSDLLGF